MIFHKKNMSDEAYIVCRIDISVKIFRSTELRLIFRSDLFHLLSLNTFPHARVGLICLSFVETGRALGDISISVP